MARVANNTELTHGSEFALMIGRNYKIASSILYSCCASKMLKLVNLVISAVYKALGVAAKVFLKFLVANEKSPNLDRRFQRVAGNPKVLE